MCLVNPVNQRDLSLKHSYMYSRLRGQVPRTPKPLGNGPQGILILLLYVALAYEV